MLLQDRRIFIIEDNTQNRIVFQMVFINQGAAVEFERRGSDAIARLQSIHQVDLIILDLMLANGISGFDIFDQIRVLPKFAEVPIVAVSAMDPAVALPKARAMGFNGFIAKPIVNRLFPEQLAAIIGGEKVWYAGERSLT